MQLLGSLKKMWNELEVYRPHSTDSTVLLKRAEEDKIFQLLSSLGSEYEDLRSHILMNPDLPSFVQCMGNHTEGKSEKEGYEL